jgi:hypothetical protein
MTTSVGCKHINWIIIAVLALGMLVGASSVTAQETASGLVFANVLAGLSVTAVQDLNFGDVLQGIAKNVANDDAVNAGIFTITGEAGAGITVYMALPEYLATPTGDDRLTIMFGPDVASVDTTINVDPSAFGSGWQNTNPYNLPSGITVGTVGQNQTAVFIGGRVVPAINQKSDTYSGYITVTVAYTGT